MKCFTGAETFAKTRRAHIFLSKMRGNREISGVESAIKVTSKWLLFLNVAVVTFFFHYLIGSIRKSTPK